MRDKLTKLAHTYKLFINVFIQLKEQRELIERS